MARTVTAIHEQFDPFTPKYHIHFIIFSVAYDVKCLGNPALGTILPLEIQLWFPHPSVSSLEPVTFSELCQSGNYSIPTMTHTFDCMF